MNQKEILLVEDHLSTGYRTKSILEEQIKDSRIYWCKSVEETITILDSDKPFDLFILDIKLKPHERGGFLIAKKVREKDKYKNIPIIFITTYQILAAEAEDYEAVAIIEKGITGVAEQIVNNVKKYLK